jgi:hypothetical protein
MRTSPERYVSMQEAERALWKMADDGRADCTHDRRFYATGMDRILEVRKTLQPDAGLECVQRLDDRLYDWQATLSTLQR